jgi:hypothetical protein
MWRRKKLIMVAILATAVLLAGSIGGVALAQTGSTGDTTSGKTLLARVAAILGIDRQKVEDAFAQARREMRDEALDSYLKNLVDKGKITQQQADQYKAWVKSRPDMSQYQQKLKEWQQARPAMPPELKDWQSARPNVPAPRAFGRGPLGGMKWG